MPLSPSLVAHILMNDYGILNQIAFDFATGDWRGLPATGSGDKRGGRGRAKYELAFRHPLQLSTRNKTYIRYLPKMGSGETPRFSLSITNGINS